MTAPFRVLGDPGRPYPFVPKRRTMTSQEILRAMAFDPHRPWEHARLQAIHRQQAARRGVGEPTVEQQLLEWSLGTERPKDPEVTTHDNPARLGDVKRSPRTLTAGDLEFVRTFEGVDPGSVAAQDVRLLAELEASAETAAERRVVARVLEPVRRHHDRKQEEAGLLTEIARHTPSGWRSARVRDAWLPVLTERISEEQRAEIEPQLAGLPPDVQEKTLRSVEADARQQASDRIHELWAGLDAEANAKVDAARRRLSALASGADPESSAVLPRDDSDLEDARRRGREAREARDAGTEAFAGMRTIS